MDTTRDVLEGTYKIEEYLVSAKREEKKQVIIADLWAKKKKKKTYANMKGLHYA